VRVGTITAAITREQPATITSTGGRLTGYEPTSVPVATAFGYNWDRPCAFVDDRTFVLALDDSVNTLDEEEAAAYRYRQLAFFEIPELPSTSHAERWLEPSLYVDSDVFPRNRYGEVKASCTTTTRVGLPGRADRRRRFLRRLVGTATS
jgi:hypothetical protein